MITISHRLDRHVKTSAKINCLESRTEPSIIGPAAKPCRRRHWLLETLFYEYWLGQWDEDKTEGKLLDQIL